jgi:predicted tellurium resistance membrane protein TerC
MKNPLMNILNLIPEAIKDRFDRISSVRIQAVLTFGVITIFAFSLLAIELTTAIVAIYTTGKYIISNEIIIILTALLAHHIALLFNKTKEFSNKVKDDEKKVDKKDDKKSDEPDI